MNLFSALSFLSSLNYPPIPSIICVLWRLQMLAYILPNDGWSKLNYSDANFQIIQNISQALLIGPICSTNIQYVLLTLFGIAHLCGLVVYLILIFDLEFFTKRGYRGALMLYNQFILLNNQLLMLPQYFLYLTFIFDLNLLPSIVSFILLFMVAFYNVFGAYFLRCYQFTFKSELCLKYSVFQNLEQILFLGLNMIYIQANSNTFTFIALIMIHLINVLKMRKIIMEEPHTVRLNVLIFKIIVMLEFVNIIITLEVAYDQIDVTKNILLTSIMIYGSLGYYLGSVYMESFISTPFEELQNHNVVSHCQRMFQFSNKQRHSPKYFFLLQYYLKHHYDRCKIPIEENQTKTVKQIIQCILSQQLLKARANNKELYEDLQLAYISFLAEQCKKPLMAFIELRKYQQQSETKTYFYQYSQIHIAQGMQDQIRKAQKQYIDFDKHLDISQISKAITLEQALIPRYLQIIDLKINLWQNQIKGFNTIYNLQDLALELSSKIDATENYLRENISQNTTNVVQLRLLSIFNCAVMNDYSQTNFYEQIISDILNNEQSSDNITNLKIIEEKATYLMISMVKSRGTILNSNKKSLQQYFKSENVEYHHLSQIMPYFFSEIHDSLLAYYLSTSQSKFLSQFICVFGLSGSGFILPQLLKIDHNFTIMDDYVLTGLLSRFRENSDYILFNQEGIIIGITQNLYDLYFHRMLDYKMLCKTFIYMFMPSIIGFLNFFRGQQEKLGDDFILEENTQLYLYQNFIDINKKYQSLNIIVPHKRQIQSYSSKFFKSEQSNTGKSKSMGDEIESIGLYESYYQDQIKLFIENIDVRFILIQNIDCQKYNIRFQLTQQKVGRDNFQKAFFVLEILDIKQDKPGESSLFVSNFSSRKPRNIINIINIIASNSLHFSQNISELNQIDRDLQFEITPNQRLEKTYSQLIKRYDRKPELNINLIDSAREDNSYGPISQRVNFISPTSKQENDNILEKDFIDLQIQIANISNIDVPDDPDLEPEPDPPGPDQQSKQDNKQSSSEEKKQNSQKVLEIMRQTKLHGRDFEPNNSKSSKTSGTSGATAIHLIRKFQQFKALLPSLKIIIFINLVVLAGTLTILILHLQVTQQDNEYTLQMLNDINGPLLFNRYFFNLFQCSWSLVYNSLGIIKSSDYLLNRILEAIKVLEQNLFQDLDALYSTFVSIEKRGLLSPIPMYVLYNGNMDVDYTYFVNFIQDLAKTLLTASKYDITNLSKLITTEYTNALLCLRYNLKDVNIMINELMSSLNIIFFSEQSRLVEVYKQQVIIEVVVLGFVISLQIYFWFKIEKYVQQLLLLLGRLQENQAQIMISKMLYIKDILQQQTGKYAWKRQNFNVIYFKQHQGQLLNDQNKQIKRAYLNVVLNQRVYRTQIQIIKPLVLILITYSIILLYLFGGFFIYQQQVSDLSPSQQLTQNYIQFSYLLDTVTTCAFIIKTQPSMYDTMANQNLYLNSTLNTFRDGGIVFKIFNNIYSNYTENMTTIVQNIVESTRISAKDKKQLFSLYQESFCDIIADELPFCSDPPYYQVVQEYGYFDSDDVNSDYFSQGIQGIISKLNFMFVTLYSYEITNSAYITDRTILKQQAGTKEFSNAIFEHFLDTTKGTNLFLQIIQQSTEEIMNNNLEQIYLYYTILGTSILIAYILCFSYWIYQTHTRIIYLRLSLTNLPIEILTENNTLSLLKRMLY